MSTFRGLTKALKDGEQKGSKEDKMFFGDRLDYLQDEANAELVEAKEFLEVLMEVIITKPHKDTLVARTLRGLSSALNEALYIFGRYRANPMSKMGGSKTMDSELIQSTILLAYENPSLREELLPVITASLMADPSVVSMMKNWAADLTPDERRISERLAKKVKSRGVSTGMFKELKEIGLPFSMDQFLRYAQMDKSAQKEFKDSLVAMLEMGASGRGRMASYESDQLKVALEALDQAGLPLRYQKEVIKVLRSAESRGWRPRKGHPEDFLKVIEDYLNF